MARPMPESTEFTANAFGTDLHQFIEQYEAAYPQEVFHVEEPLRADWEITALAIKLEKSHRFPVLVCHNVIVEGKRAELPVVTFLMASRLRLARTFGVDVRRAGVACYERVQKRVKPIVVSRDQAPVKQVVEKGADIDVRRFPAPLHHRMAPAERQHLNLNPPFLLHYSDRCKSTPSGSAVPYFPAAQASRSFSVMSPNLRPATFFGAD